MMSLTKIGEAFVDAEVARALYEQAERDRQAGRVGDTSEARAVADATRAVAVALVAGDVEAELAKRQTPPSPKKGK